VLPHWARSDSFAPIVIGLRNLFESVRDPGRTWIDQVLALVMAVVAELQIWLNDSVHDRPQAALAAVLLCGAVGVRRRWPLESVLVGIAAVSVEAVFGGSLANHVSVALPAGMLLFYGAGAFLDQHRARIALVIGVLGLLPQILLTPHAVSDLFFEPVIMALLPWLCGRWVRERIDRAHQFRELSERLDTEREQGASTAADQERMRIARELHDVIGHYLSVIVLQAGGARMVIDSQPERAADAMLVVERAGHEALAEVRHLLGVLGAEPGGGLAPQPGLATIEDLVVRTREAGLETDLLVDGIPKDVSPALALCAYRIVQEGLTNTIKHAGPARATVRLRWAEERLELEIADDGRGSVTDDRGPAGHGIIGMHERAALHHGSVQVMARNGSGYLVRASLPLIGGDGR
jgi:MYXO-CTERM domain-containing protein